MLFFNFQSCTQKITALYICLEHVQSFFISFISCARKQKQGLHVIHIQISLCKIVWKTKILRTRLGWREGLLKKCIRVCMFMKMLIIRNGPLPVFHLVLHKLQSFSSLISSSLWWCPRQIRWLPLWESHTHIYLKCQNSCWVFANRWSFGWKRYLVSFP